MTKLFNGPKNSITDIDGFLVGNAHDENIKSGVTVLTSSTSFRASVSILGGAPGTKETDLLSPDKVVENIDGIVLAIYRLCSRCSRKNNISIKGGMARFNCSSYS